MNAQRPSSQLSFPSFFTFSLLNLQDAEISPASIYTSLMLQGSISNPLCHENTERIGNRPIYISAKLPTS
jgi:hypothetical protein